MRPLFEPEEVSDEREAWLEDALRSLPEPSCSRAWRRCSCADSSLADVPRGISRITTSSADARHSMAWSLPPRDAPPEALRSFPSRGEEAADDDEPLPSDVRASLLRSLLRSLLPAPAA